METVNSEASRALELLRAGTGLPDARFRQGQAEAIAHVVEGRGRLLVVQRTGWGKSYVYFIAAKLLREEGGGPALLVSPLLALMRNQIAAAERICQCPVPVIHDARRAGDPAQLVASNGKAMDALEWRPAFSDIETILETAWEWTRRRG